MDHISNSATDRKAETVRIFNSFQEFIRKLQAVYGIADEERAAEREDSSETAPDDFRDEVPALASRFCYGLKETVKDDISRTDRLTTPDDLTKLSVKIDNRMYERKLEKGEQQKPVLYANVTRRRNLTGPPPRDTYPIAMELDATKKRKGRLCKVQRDERK